MRILASAKPSSKNICMVETKTYIYGAPKSGRLTGHWHARGGRVAAQSCSCLKLYTHLLLLCLHSKQRLFNVLTFIKMVKHHVKARGVILILTHMVHYLRRWCMLGRQPNFLIQPKLLRPTPPSPNLLMHQQTLSTQGGDCELYTKRLGNGDESGCRRGKYA